MSSTKTKWYPPRKGGYTGQTPTNAPDEDVQQLPTPPKGSGGVGVQPRAVDKVVRRG